MQARDREQSPWPSVGPVRSTAHTLRRAADLRTECAGLARRSRDTIHCNVWGSIAVAALLGLGAPAESSIRVALLPLAADASVEPGTAASVQEQLEQGLRRGGIELVPAEELARSLPAACREAACIRDVAAKTGARFVVRPGLVHRDRVFTVELDLLRGDTGESVATSRDECDICGRQEVAAVASDQASRLRDKIDALAAPPTLLRIDSTPTGAAVWVDGEHVGQTPLVREVLAGEHVVRIEHPGYASEQRRLDTTTGLEHELNLALVALPPQAVPSTKPSTLVVGGAVTLVAGAIATIGGAVLLAIDERQYQRRCSGDDVDVNGTCRFSYDTLTAGAVLTGAGLAAVGAGVGMIVVGKRRNQRLQAGLTPRGLVLRGRF